MKQIILDQKQVQIFLLKRIFEQECVVTENYDEAFYMWLRIKGLITHKELKRLLK